MHNGSTYSKINTTLTNPTSNILTKSSKHFMVSNSVITFLERIRWISSNYVNQLSKSSNKNNFNNLVKLLSNKRKTSNNSEEKSKNRIYTLSINQTVGMNFK